MNTSSEIFDHLLSTHILDFRDSLSLKQSRRRVKMVHEMNTSSEIFDYLPSTHFKLVTQNHVKKI